MKAARRVRGWSFAVACAALLAAPSNGQAMERIVFVADSSLINVTLRSPRELPTDMLARRLRFLAQAVGAPGGIMADYDRFHGYRNIGLGVELMSQVFKPKAIVVMFGYNDFNLNTPVETFADAYREFLASMPADVPIVCITPLWTQREGEPNTAGDVLADYRAAVADACSAHRVVDGVTLIDHDSKYFSDGLHPNHVGNAQLASRLVPVLKPLLRN